MGAKYPLPAVAEAHTHHPIATAATYLRSGHEALLVGQVIGKKGVVSPVVV